MEGVEKRGNGKKIERACCGAKIGTWWPTPLMVAKVRQPSYSSTHTPICLPSNQASLFHYIQF